MSSETKERIREDVRSLKKEIILQAAAELFISVGYNKTKVDDIAAKCGVTKPFVYYHFSSKNEILCELCIHATGGAYAAIEDAETIKGTPEHKFSFFVRTFSEIALRNYSFVELYYREAVNLPPDISAKILDMRIRIEEILVNIIREGVAADRFNVDDIRMTARSILSMASFSFAWYGRARKMNVDEVVDRMETIARKLVA